MRITKSRFVPLKITRVGFAMRDYQKKAQNNFGGQI
jgi:hypothetical protein